MTDSQYEYPKPDESITTFCRRLWLEVDPLIRDACVRYLRSELDVEVADFWREQIEKDPDEWVLRYHSTVGMQVRNCLRDVVFDDRLPSGNWDDYYSAALEDAVLGEYRP